MTLLILWIITNFIAVGYWVFLRFKFLELLNKQPFEDYKPFTCYFCMANWIGFLVGIINFDIDSIYFVMFNFITAYALGKLTDI